MHILALDVGTSSVKSAVLDQGSGRTVGTRPLPGGTSALCFAQQVADDTSLKGRVKHYLHANGWIGLRLTGEKAFDPGNASFTGLFGTCTDRQWSQRWCGYFGVDPA